ncbi:MAG: response regulator transcription factor [Anaerolineales bacterium]|nr:response regulator transcription factor [Anaerolineales bacterium]MCW5855718.1 response regulator transcription factor [Anaerolineales bacterium]
MDASTLRAYPRIPILLLIEQADLRQMLVAGLSLQGYLPGTKPTTETQLVILHSGPDDPPGALASQLAAWQAKGVPVMVISSEREAGYGEACLEMGASEYLSMPFELEDLLERIRLCLSLPAQTQTF